MKLAHLILTHTKPAQLERLIKRLQHRDAVIYIHLDKNTDKAPFEYLSTIGNVFFITNRVAVEWGNYSMVQAQLNGFEEILATQNTLTHINLLSAQDYPLKSAGEIHQFLLANADKTFIRWFAIPGEWDEPAERLLRYNFGDYQFMGRHRLQALANRLLPSRKPPAGLQIFGRSQWFTITPVCAAYVIGYLQQHKNVRRFFKQTWACDELIFQTILLNSPLKDTLVNDHLRYIKFKPRDSRPQTLTMADAAGLQTSGKFYARKFDGDIDGDILNHLDKLNAPIKTRQIPKLRN